MSGLTYNGVPLVLDDPAQPEPAYLVKPPADWPEWAWRVMRVIAPRAAYVAARLEAVR